MAVVEDRETEHEQGMKRSGRGSGGAGTIQKQGEEEGKLEQREGAGNEQEEAAKAVEEDGKEEKEQVQIDEEETKQQEGEEWNGRCGCVLCVCVLLEGRWAGAEEQE